RLPGFFSENSDKVVSIKSKVMDIIVLRTEVTPYNGRDEPLTLQIRLQRFAAETHNAANEGTGHDQRGTDGHPQPRTCPFT
ncbi:hypothetical protein, partial [Caballeronia sp. EK]|uniref:hypothetical protein n=1 Tax=Caballeronia sp. EK TaxID=2767469 RepID=UPI001CA40401